MVAMVLQALDNADKHIGNTILFYDKHLSTNVTPRGAQWFLTCYCQMILKTILEKYLSFNNDIFGPDTWKYGNGFSDNMLSTRIQTTCSKNTSETWQRNTK